MSADGNITISELSFVPTAEDNGKTIICSVSTDAKGNNGGYFHKDSRRLDVKRKFIVHI